MSQRFEGRNLEEALALASQSYGVDAAQLTHRVLLEKRGFLGGIKRIVIEAEVNPAGVSAAPAAPATPSVSAPVPSADISTEEPLRVLDNRPAAESERPRRQRSRGGRGRGAGQAGGAKTGGGAGERGRGRRGSFSDREESDLRSGDFEHFFADVPEQGPESEAAASVRGWIEKVLAAAKFDLQVRTSQNETQVLISLYGPDAKRMLDRHGEVLDALQVLANKSLGGRSIEKDIELDCEGFKEKRSGDLERRARSVADRVRRDGREQLLPAMSPIERRIVHIALRDDAHVTTESRGEGFLKRVAIVPRGASETPPPADERTLAADTGE